MASNKKEWIKRNKKTGLLLLVLIAYGLYLLIAGTFKGVYFQSNEWIRSIVGESCPTPYDISYYASAEQDFLFFTSIGLIAFLLGLRDPKDESLAAKVKYIFPEVEEQSHHFSYLIKEIDEMSCISTNTERTIILEEFLEQKNGEIEVVKISVDTKVSVTNIHHNNDFKHDKLTFGMKSDGISDEKGIKGQIYDLSIIYDGERREKFIDGVHTLKDEDEFRRSYSLTLKPKQKAMYNAHAWLWENLATPLSFIASRYTEEAVLSFINRSEKGLKIKDLTNNETQEFPIGEKITIKFNNIEPGMRRSFELSVLQET